MRCGPRLSSSSCHFQCVPALILCARYVVALVRVCASLSLHLAPWPRGCFSWLPALVTPLWFSREVGPRLDRALRLRLSAMASDLHGVLVAALSGSSLSIRENPVYSFNLPPSAFRLCGLALWGHDHSSTGRPSRHRQFPSTCSFCHDTDGSLMHHLSACPSHHNARTAWSHSCGISLPEASVLAQHSWVFNPLDEANTPQTIGAHILFVGHVCDQLQPPSW